MTCHSLQALRLCSLRTVMTCEQKGTSTFSKGQCGQVAQEGTTARESAGQGVQKLQCL